MQREQSITEILDEAILALTALDLNKLEELETRVTSMASTENLCSSADYRRASEKKRLLGMLLENCKSNLDALSRLHSRNARGEWAH